MESEIINFLYQSFVLPLADETVHYNVYNTLVYALLFSLGVVYLLPKVLERLEVRDDKYFYLSIVPWVLTLSSIRVWHDQGLVESVLFVTPFIYIWGIAGILTATFLLSRLIDIADKYDFAQSTFRITETDEFGPKHHALAFTGLISLMISLTIIPQISFWDPLIIGSIVFIASSWATVTVVEIVSESYEDHWAVILPFIGHLWDASSTFAGVMYGAEEKHVLADWFITHFGSSGIFLLKILLVAPAIIIINQKLEQDRIYYLSIIGLLGVALGSRNFLTIVTGV